MHLLLLFSSNYVIGNNQNKVLLQWKLVPPDKSFLFFSLVTKSSFWCFDFSLASQGKCWLLGTFTNLFCRLSSVWFAYCCFRDLSIGPTLNTLADASLISPIATIFLTRSESTFLVGMLMSVLFLSTNFFRFGHGRSCGVKLAWLAPTFP